MALRNESLLASLAIQLGAGPASLGLRSEHHNGKEQVHVNNGLTRRKKSMTTIMAFRLASVVTAVDVLVACGFSIAAIIRPQVLVPAGGSTAHVGRGDGCVCCGVSRWLFQSVTVHPRIQPPLWSPAISGCGADPATVSASRTTRPTCGLTPGWSAKPDATPSNSKGKIYLKGPIVPLEIAKGCHKVLDLAS